VGRIAWFVGGGNVANEEHLAQLKRGVKAWNEWRSANPKVRPDLSDANLNGAHLRGADLGAADLKEAQMGYTFFADDDLSSTKGLDAVHHRAASSIGIDTIYKSQGKIPLAFLRGCGVPENFITYMPSLVAEGAIQFYSCFISYSTKDQEFAERLYADLQSRGVRCWFAPHDVQGGRFLEEQIDAAIRLHEKVLLILSPDSIHSDWVQLEVGKARERARRRRRSGCCFPSGW